MQLFTKALSIAIIFWIGTFEGIAQAVPVASEIAQQPFSEVQIDRSLLPRSDETLPNGGGYIVKLGERTVIYPNGDKLEPNGTITTHDGFRFQLILRNNTLVGIQIYRANGKKLNPGESLLLRNGQIVTQEAF